MPWHFITVLPMQEIRSAVAAEFEQVNQLIVQQLHSDVDMVENIGHYIVDAGGKRLRQLLVLLTAAALGRCDAPQVKIAAVIEFIHNSTPVSYTHLRSHETT